ncbi:MAG: hypothetical protein H6735_01290 [Alphaproteobacteria bacterium]|nr:hypothetical protein [Alphaproteobacteria bacterium]
MSHVRPGILVRDNHDRPGLLVHPQPRPSKSWLKAQTDRRVAATPEDDTWWHVLCLDGGAIVCPESLLTVLGPPSEADIAHAMAHANAAGRQTLTTLFPSGSPP